MKKVLKNSITRFFALTLCLIFATSSLFGCEFLHALFNREYDFYFVTEEKVLTKDDEWSISSDEFDFSPSKPRAFSFTLASSDEQVLSVNSHIVTAVGEGTATLTATGNDGKTASCTVTVNKEIFSMRLFASERSRRLSDKRATEVFVILNDGARSAENYAVEWNVDGKILSYTGCVYTLPPYGDTATYRQITATVTAKDGSKYTDSVLINRHDDCTVPVTIEKIEGITNQTQKSAVRYKVNYHEGHSYLPVIDWMVNGVVMQEEGNEFSFTPDKIGKYEITASVDGTVASAQENIVTLSGSEVPGNIKVDCDTLYPSTLISWNETTENESFKVSVKSGSSEQIYDVSDNSLVLSSAQFNAFSPYEIKVKSEGNDDWLTPSGYSEIHNFSPVSEEAKPFLEKEWFGGNYFITSDDEFYAIYDYYMLFRTQPIGDESTSSECKIYLGYEPSKSVSRLAQSAFDKCSYTGTYDVNTHQTGRYVTVGFKFYTMSTPYQSNAVTGTNINGALPHLSSTGRESETLYIDTLSDEKAVEVTTTDELYRVAELGYKPVPKSSSRASTYYDYARNLLRQITDENMSEYELAHAVFDWITWRVTYDQKAAEISEISEAVKNSAFYLESVLTDTGYMAVCDGMSKAYSLLCNMLGLECVRVTGKANSGDGDFGHAWNKVKIDGKWYIVDCTWSDLRATFSVKKSVYSKASSVTSELALHEFFLKTDWELESSHFENDSADYPKTTYEPYNYYNENFYSADGNECSFYITDWNAVQGSVSALSKYVSSLFDADGKRRYFVCGKEYISEYALVEILVSPVQKEQIFIELHKTGLKDMNYIESMLYVKGINSKILLNDNAMVIIASKNYYFA
ncbi:MAG: hypothetical protein IJX06_04940 [Clostridia bacterium]|nr:hypothetical protein [Clostridia bacterium]